jgi:hypothetical protein
MKKLSKVRSAVLHMTDGETALGTVVGAIILIAACWQWGSVLQFWR